MPCVTNGAASWSPPASPCKGSGSSKRRKVGRCPLGGVEPRPGCVRRLHHLEPDHLGCAPVVPREGTTAPPRRRGRENHQTDGVLRGDGLGPPSSRLHPMGRARPGGAGLVARGHHAGDGGLGGLAKGPAHHGVVPRALHHLGPRGGRPTLHLGARCPTVPKRQGGGKRKDPGEERESGTGRNPTLSARPGGRKAVRADRPRHNYKRRPTPRGVFSAPRPPGNSNGASLSEAAARRVSLDPIGLRI